MAPSYEEIAGHFGISSPSVNGMVKTLERRGLLSRVPGVARSLRVLVPAAQLPGGDFGPPSAPAPRAVAAASVQDAIGAAAIAVLDVLMPHLKSESGQDHARGGTGTPPRDRHQAQGSRYHNRDKYYDVWS